MRDPHDRWRHRLSPGPVGPPPLYGPGDLDDEPLGVVGVWSLIAVYVGITLHGVLAYFPLGYTLFVAPLPVIVAVYGSWLALWKVILRWRDSHPSLVLAMPIAEVAAWFALMQVGWQLLGWPSIHFPENR